MATLEEAYGQNHRQQRSLTLGLSALLLVFAIAPRQERALFITEQPGLSAFGAAFPPINFGDLLPLYGNALFPGVPRAFFARTPFGPAAPGLPEPFGPAGGGAPGAPGAPFADGNPLGPFGGPLADTAPVAGPGSTFPFPGFSGPPLASPVVVGTPNVTPTPEPTTEPTPAPTATPSPPVVVPAVPEPATWATMIVGFLLAGASLRRRRRYSSSSRLPLKVTEPSCDSAL